MAHNNKEVSRLRPCPICGKTDYCSFYTGSNNSELVICKREYHSDSFIGKDGVIYKYISQSRKGNYVYQELGAYELSRDAWLREHNYGPYRPDSSKQNPQKQTCMNPPSFQPVEWKEVDHIDPLSHEELDHIYRVLLDHLVLDDIHKNYLKSEGWTDEMIELNLIRSFPEKDLIRFKVKNFFSKNPYRKTLASKIMETLHKTDLLGVPGAFIDHNGNWTFAGPKGILFPLYDINGYIYGLRIRMDFMDMNIKLTKNAGTYYYHHNNTCYFFEPLKGYYTVSNGRKEYLDKQGYYSINSNGEEVFTEIRGKYRPLTSFHQSEKKEFIDNHLIANSYTKGCQLESGLSIYMHDTDDFTICYLTEGEKKGCFSNMITHCPFVTVPGVEAWSGMFEGEKGQRLIDQLIQKGVKFLIVAYDADKETNTHVLNAQKKAIDAIIAEGIMVGVAYWNMKDGKGLDDLLYHGFQPGFDIVNY